MWLGEGEKNMELLLGVGAGVLGGIEMVEPGLEIGILVFGVLCGEPSKLLEGVVTTPKLVSASSPGFNGASVRPDRSRRDSTCTYEVSTGMSTSKSC